MPLCERRGDAERVARYGGDRATRASRSIDAQRWDGDWYRRAYYDDGTPLGSAQNDECRIDALAQAWAVISAPRRPSAPRTRWTPSSASSSMRGGAADPPADAALRPHAHDPGYIKGYVPGIRENGGQYTHAALWVVRAFAELGRRERAVELLEMLSRSHHTRTPRGGCASTRSSPTSWSPTSTASPPHVGRGGWTWYTGSAGWMYRVALESVLGLRMEDGVRLVLRPCVPDAWPSYRIDYRVPDCGTRYAIAVRRTGGSNARVVAIAVDGAALAPVDGAAVWPIARDGASHSVEIELGV